MMRSNTTPRRAETGFTLTEIVVVVGIIMVMLAVSAPAVTKYIKNYQLRGAAQQVAGEITTARGKAIMKNVNFGVVFVVLSANTYRWVLEDSYKCPLPNGTTPCTSRQSLTDLINAGEAGPIRTLPSTVVFTTGCTYEGTAFTGNDAGFRFSRYGANCDPGSNTTTCPALTIGLENSIMNTATGGAMLCLGQDNNGDGVADIRRVVNVAPGGRVNSK